MNPIHFDDYLEYLYVTDQLESTIDSENVEGCQEDDSTFYSNEDVENEDC